MDLLTILALAVKSTTPETAKEEITLLDNVRQHIWTYVTSLGPVEALTFISFGTVWLFYGWRVFKILVTISFGVLGLLLGVWANKELVGGNVIWLSLMTGALLAIVSVPLTRWGVTFLGAAAGGLLTGGAWYAFGLPEKYILAGVLVGLVAGAMISFIVFKIAVMLFTGLGGSCLMVAGALAILYQYMGAAEKLQGWFFNEKWFLPLMLLTPMVIGIIIQYKFIKGAKDWTV
jgi:hypothetical protein